MKPMRLLALLALVWPSCAWAQTPPQTPNVNDLLVLGKCLAAYRQSEMTEIKSAGKLVFRLGGVELPMTVTGQSFAAADGRFLCSMQMEAMGDTHRLSVACDGTNVTEYCPDDKKYAVYPLADLIKSENTMSEFALSRGLPVLPLAMTLRTVNITPKPTSEAELKFFRALDLTKLPTTAVSGEPIYVLNMMKENKPNMGEIQVAAYVNTNTAQVKGMQLSVAFTADKAGLSIVYNDGYDCRLNAPVKPDQLQLVLPTDAVKVDKLPSLLEKVVAPIIPLVAGMQAK